MTILNLYWIEFDDVERRCDAFAYGCPILALMALSIDGLIETGVQWVLNRDSEDPQMAQRPIT
jgi:hypothetical protein